MKLCIRCHKPNKGAIFINGYCYDCSKNEPDFKPIKEFTRFPPSAPPKNQLKGRKQCYNGRKYYKRNGGRPKKYQSFEESVFNLPDYRVCTKCGFPQPIANFYTRKVNESVIVDSYCKKHRHEVNNNWKKKKGIEYLRNYHNEYMRTRRDKD